MLSKVVSKNIEDLLTRFKSIIDSEEDSKSNTVNEFINKVIPALANPIIIKDISNCPRFVCHFEHCIEHMKSFSTRQKFIYHLINIHGKRLPQGGNFLLKNDKGIKNEGFKCSKCYRVFTRKDHYVSHCKKSLECYASLNEHNETTQVKSTKVKDESRKINQLTKSMSEFCISNEKKEKYVHFFAFLTKKIYSS